MGVRHRRVFVRWWMFPLVLALVAGSFPMLPSGDLAAAFWWNLRLLFGWVGLIWAIVGLAAPLIRELIRLSDRPRPEPRGFDVIVHSPSTPTVPSTDPDVLIANKRPTIDYAAHELPESTNEFWGKVITSVAVALLIFMGIILAILVMVVPA